MVWTFAGVTPSTARHRRGRSSRPAPNCTRGASASQRGGYLHDGVWLHLATGQHWSGGCPIHSSGGHGGSAPGRDRARGLHWETMKAPTAGREENTMESPTIMVWARLEARDDKRASKRLERVRQTGKIPLSESLFLPRPEIRLKFADVFLEDSDCFVLSSEPSILCTATIVVRLSKRCA